MNNFKVNTSASLLAASAALLSIAAVAASSGNASGSASAVADSTRRAKLGDAVAFSRLLAFGKRCNVNPGLMGSAMGSVTAVGMRNGSIRSMEDLKAQSNVGMAQVKDVPTAAIDCAATRRAMVELAGPDGQPEPVPAADDPHARLIARHACTFDAESPAALMMAAYLNEKNGIDVLPQGGEHNLRETRLADTFISPRYIDRYRIVPGTFALDGYGSQPERLVCVRVRGGVPEAVTAITNRDAGWTQVLLYQLVEEKGRHYIQPLRPPQTAQVSPLLWEHQPEVAPGNRSA